jgi:hypothetical protein
MGGRGRLGPEVVVTGASSGVGRVVKVGSALAYRGIPLQSAYFGAKHAVQGFTESVRCELLHEGSGVRIVMVQLPALNTSQFERGAVPAHPPGPAGPPDLPARGGGSGGGVGRHHPRREPWVGGSTAVTVLANRVAAGLLDRYRGLTGYRSQQTDEPELPDRPSNLWRPVPGDRGAHGRFDVRAHSRSVQLWLSTHRWWAMARPPCWAWPSVVG